MSTRTPLEQVKIELNISLDNTEQDSIIQDRLDEVEDYIKGYTYIDDTIANEPGLFWAWVRATVELYKGNIGGSLEDYSSEVTEIKDGSTTVKRSKTSGTQQGNVEQVVVKLNYLTLLRRYVKPIIPK